MRLRLYEPLDSEMRAFNSMDSPDLYFEFYPQVYPGRRGSMVSFGLRILHAELPHFMGRHQESLDKLYYILAVTSKIVKNLEAGLSEDGAGIELKPESRAVSLKLWSNRETQVQYKIASVLLSMKDYEAAISIFEMLAEKETENKINLMSGIGRIYLQMGNISKATDAFKQVENETTKGGNAAMNSINKGFLAMCVNNFSDAYEHFKSAVNLEPSNTCAVNNMAVCSLYMCRLKDALNTLEALVHKDPGHNLHEGVLFNLCTLYELESSRALHKKQAVLDMVNKHKGDGFPVVCLKMS
ncbi:trafficking protein particle complex subunit 12 [Patella vulgata]|uniref:trafficking protein particle complex subunit 12 n=1 Tax=Patella vulgata TaxID=6465 RepID=UPI0024A9A3CE|nr:trafficking protein particle complex subunit 12 [Patella vulgata]